MNTRKRDRKQPAHLSDYEECQITESVQRTYKVVLDSNKKEYSADLTELEIGGIPAKEENLDVGSEVVWLYKGKRPYAAQVVELPASSCDTGHTTEFKNPSHNVCKKRRQIIQEDDENFDDFDDADCFRQQGDSEKVSSVLSPLTSAGHVTPQMQSTPQDSLSVTPKKLITRVDKDKESFRQQSSATTHMELLINIDKKLSTLLEHLIPNTSTNQKAPKGTNQKAPAIKKETTPIPPKASSSIIIDDEDMSLSLVSKKDASSYALNLMDVLFTDDEMKGHLLVKRKRSRSDRSLLDQERVKKLFGMIASEFGKEETKKNFDEIVNKCNQKCRDKEKPKAEKAACILDDLLSED